jgi:diketogulonate reductase-like aldo/keto reductase
MKNLIFMNITDIQGRVSLSNGVKMPYFGLGVFGAREGKETVKAVRHALETGYRLIDTASMYGNEKSVGQAIRESDLSRKEIFITTKVWNSDQGYDQTLRAFDRSMHLLGFDYLDLYLIHWPVPGKFKATWKALESIYREGRVRSIGVSNFMQHHLVDLFTICEIQPMVNQVEFHPYLIQPSLLDFCKRHHIQYEAWSPIMKGRVNNIELFKMLGKKYGKSPVQIVLRWDLQKEVVTIPKSSQPDRIRSNAELFDFEISKEDMNKIDQLDNNNRTGPDPENIKF